MKTTAGQPPAGEAPSGRKRVAASGVPSGEAIVTSRCENAAAGPARTAAAAAAATAAVEVLTTTRKRSRCPAGRRRARPSLQSPHGRPAHRRVRFRGRRPDRPARVPGDDATRGLRLPRRRSTAAVRPAAARRDPPLRRRDRGLPGRAGREARRGRVQLGDGGGAARPAADAVGSGRGSDPARGARRRARHEEPARGPARHGGDRRERALRGARSGRSTRASRYSRSPARGSCR